MKISDYSFSHVGQKSENEDATLLHRTQDDVFWAAIADGMGGQVGGRVASATAIKVVKANLEKSNPPSIPAIFASVRDELKKIAEKQPELQKMGTTLSLISLRGHLAQVGHVGDSRIYHLRNEGIISRTVDQTEAQELIARGILSKTNALRYPRRNILLSVLSPRSDYSLLEENFEIQAGDRIVLMTDGVSSKVFVRELRDLSLEFKDARTFCEQLVKKVEQRQPVDDYTAICLDITT